jgi:hypothetical protein
MALSFAVSSEYATKHSLPSAYSHTYHDDVNFNDVLAKDVYESQYNDFSRRINDVNHDTDRTIPDQVDIMPPSDTGFDERDNFLLALHSKHNVPSTYRGNTHSRRSWHNNPQRRAVRRDELDPEHLSTISGLEKYDNNYSIEKMHKHEQLSKVVDQTHDGRTRMDGSYVDTTSTGEEIAYNQNVYEAMWSRPDHGIKRELNALREVRNIQEIKGRAICYDSQLPNAVHRPSIESDKIPRRSVKTRPQAGSMNTGTSYFAPYSSPDTVLRPVVEEQAWEQRREVDGQFKHERPMIQNFIQGKTRPRVTYNRTPNPSGNHDYYSASAVNGDRNQQLMTDYKPIIVNNNKQRPIWAVAGNRAMRQFRQDQPYEYDKSNGVTNYKTGMIQRQNMNPNQYQSSFIEDVMLNKVNVVDRAPQLLTHRDPLLAFARNIDNHTL